MKRTQKKGFTIVELVIVIAVIAILAAVLIPTFSGLIKKANMSVDMQIVNQMNTALQADEIVSGRPATVVEAKEILVENGCDDFTPADAQNVYYWIGSENRVVLWEMDEGEEVTTGKVTYPKELAKKYKNITEPSADWADLSIDANTVEVVPEEGETIGDALLDAVKNSDNNAIIKLPKNAEINIGDGAYHFGEYLKGEGGTGKNVTIDLNGGKLISNEKRIVDGVDKGYHDICVPANGTLTLANGSIEITTDGSSKAALSAEAGAHLILRDVDMSTNGAAVFPSGDASEVVIEDSTVYTTGAYAIGTTNGVSNNVRITISDTSLEAASCTVLVNVPCDMHIEDSTVTGGGRGVFVRSGHVVIENTTIKTTDGDPGANDSRYNTSCEYFAYNGSDSNIPYWGSGAQAPYAPIIVGDYSSHNAYNHDTDLALTNVKIVNANSAKVPDVVVAAGPSGKDVVLDYDAATAVGRIVMYGEGYVRTEFTGLDGSTVYQINHTFNHKGTIKINGATKFFYAIPASMGTFTAGEYAASVLDVDYNIVPTYDYNATVKSQIETACGITFSDTEWATVRFGFSSGTANELKNIYYIKDGESVETRINREAYSGDNARIKLTGISEHLQLKSNQTVSVLKQTGYVQNALTEFKAYCQNVGVTVTDSSKIVIGATANVIVGVK